MKKPKSRQPLPPYYRARYDRARRAWVVEDEIRCVIATAAPCARRGVEKADALRIAAALNAAEAGPTRVLVHVEGGNVQNILTTAPAEIEVWDWDSIKADGLTPPRWVQINRREHFERTRAEHLRRLAELRAGSSHDVQS